MSAGPTTRRLGSVGGSRPRRVSSWSLSIADSLLSVGGAKVSIDTFVQ